MTYPPQQPNPPFGGAQQPPPWLTPTQAPPQFPAGGRPRHRRHTGLILSLVTVLLAAGIGTGLYFALHGKASGGPRGLADTDTIDPCSLVTAADVQYLHADVQIQPSDFSSCTVTVALRDVAESDNGTLNVVISIGHGVDPGKVRAALGANTASSTRGALHIVEQTATAGATTCAAVVYQNDGAGVTINSSMDSGSGSSADSGSSGASQGTDLCGPADHVADGVVNAIIGNTLVHLTYPKDSVGGMDLCAAIGAADVAAALPVPGLTPRPSRNTHTCAWAAGASPDSAGLVIYTKLNTVVGWADEQKYGSSTTTIAGRQTVIAKSDATDTDLFCIATVAGKAWDHWPGRMVFGGSVIQAQVASDYRAGAAAPGLVEEVNIGVTPAPGGTTDQACQAMQAIAVKLWPTLPPGN